MSVGVRAETGRLSLSRVAEQTFEIVGKALAPTYLTALGIMILPTLLATWRVQTLVAVGTTPVERLAALRHSFGPLFFLTTLVSLLCGVLVYASLSWAATERLQGRQVSVGQTLTAGLRALPSLLGVAILGYIALVLATLCLVVPAIFLATAWSLVAPVVAVERKGVFGGFGRSFELTRNNRWTIFLALLVYMVGCVIIGLAATVLVHLAFGVSGNPFFSGMTGGPSLWVSTIVNLLLGSLMRAVGATGLGVIYSELRGLTGGFDARRLGDVFA